MLRRTLAIAICRLRRSVLLVEYARSVEVYEAVLAEHPNQPKGWLSYGHALKTAGRSGESIDAYKRSLALNPAFGEAWWSLANLKTFRFAPEDAVAMDAALAGEVASNEDRLHLHYALGKAREDANGYAASFAHYAAGASIRRGQIEYDAAETTAHLERAKALFTPAFFAKREGMGCTDEAPIFVLGLPRSGSTLIEQILASHSAVEGTMELPEIVNIARSLGRGTEDEAYPAAIGDLDALQLKALGEQFIERTRIHRKLGRRFFIDKMPNNVLHVGLIHAILPNAKIIDARRHPHGDMPFRVQTALRARPALLLRSRRHRSLLPGLCGADGAFRCGAAGAHTPGDL